MTLALRSGNCLFYTYWEGVEIQIFLQRWMVAAPQEGEGFVRVKNKKRGYTIEYI
jgi:hypothetical protein